MRRRYAGAADHAPGPAGGDVRVMRVAGESNEGCGSATGDSGQHSEIESGSHDRWVRVTMPVCLQ